MDEVIALLEAHDKLAGWAQFLGAMLALALTYLTAFAPVWRRKRYLKRAAKRLLAHGYEAIESYHRTSANFLPFPQSLRQAALSMSVVVDEMNRFPIYELDDHGNYSPARRIVAMTSLASALRLFLDTMATELDDRPATEEDKQNIRGLVATQLDVARGLVTGAPLERPVWPA